MDFTLPIFYAFCGLVLLSALFVLCAKRVLYSAFALLLTLMCVAAMYVFFSADFLAIVQIMVYIGGILMLIIFGVMFTNRLSGEEGVVSGQHYLMRGAVTGTGVFLLLLLVIREISAVNLQPQIMPVTSTQTIGMGLMTNYVLALEVTGILLLVALIGTAFIAGKKLKN